MLSFSVVVQLLLDSEKQHFYYQNEEASRKASVQKLEELDEIIELSRKFDEGDYAKLGGTQEFKADFAKVVDNFSANKSLGVKVIPPLSNISIIFPKYIVKGMYVVICTWLGTLFTVIVFRVIISTVYCIVFREYCARQCSLCT